MKTKPAKTTDQSSPEHTVKTVANQFDTGANQRISEIAEQIATLKGQASQLLAETMDVWSPLGRRAPLMREAFRNVALPVASKGELLAKMGGNDRIIVAPALNGHLEPHSAADLVDSLSDFLGQVLPVSSWETLVRQIISHVHHSRGTTAQPGKPPLLRRIPKRNLKEILTTPHRLTSAVGGEKFGVYRQAFEQKRPALETLADQRPKTATGKLLALRAFKEYLPLFNKFEFGNYDLTGGMKVIDYAKMVSAHCASAITHLTNAEGYLNNCSDFLDNVLAAQTLTQGIKNYNSKAENALESANQLLSQAVADLATAEAALMHIPDNQKAQTAVAEAQDKLEQLQNLLSEITQKMAQAEDHKDILSIPWVAITIHCVEYDPCCDEDWKDVNVTIANVTHPSVPKGSGTTNGSGKCTISGRFGNSAIYIQTDGPGEWDFAYSKNVQDHSRTFTLTEDLPGNE